MKFTDRYIQKLAPRSERFEVREGDGFVLRVTPLGTKSFYYVYRSEGKLHRLFLGTWPHVSLAEAREKHRVALSQRHSGADPVKTRKAEKYARAATPNVQDLAKDYIEKHAKPNKKSWEMDRYILDKDVLPAWGDHKITDIRKRDVILLLEGIFLRAPSQSNQVLKIIRKMFNFAVERDILDTTPCYLVKPMAPMVSKERALSATEIVTFWRFLDSTKMSPEIVGGLRLILVTAQRPGEVFGLHSREISGDWWTIPPERAKNKREHRVFLTEMAKDLIGDRKGWIFPGQNGLPLQRVAPARAVRRLIESQDGNEVRLPIEKFTPHDLRRTAATHLGAAGYDNPQIGRLLNHVDTTVTATYNRHRYDSLIKKMLCLWEKKLLKILYTPTPA